MKSHEYEVRALNLLEVGLANAAQVYATLALVHTIKESNISNVSNVILK